MNPHPPDDPPPPTAPRPYPSELIESFDWHDGARVTPVVLRPVRPEDEAQHLAFLQRLAPEDVRMRIFYARRSIGDDELARLTHIDYEREMAFVATRRPDDGGPEETLGVVRLIVAPDNGEADFGLVVRSDVQRGGLGRRLMDKAIAYLRARGTRRLVATVLLENHRMLALAHALGMKPSAEQPDPTTRQLELVLAPAAGATAAPAA